MESLRALGLVGQDVQQEQDNVVNYEMYLQPEGVQLPQCILGHAGMPACMSEAGALLIWRHFARPLTVDVQCNLSIGCPCVCAARSTVS
jgi:hypothetical protein